VAKETFNVTIWFTNGESRSFGALKTYYDTSGLAIMTKDGVLSVDVDQVAMVLDESREWLEVWDA
jgi:hypothetical protein